MFVKGYWFLFFAKNMGKTVNSEYSQKLIDQAKQSATDAIKTSSKRVIQKTAEATVRLIGNKSANRITKVSKNSQQNNSETFTNEHHKEIPKEGYIPPEEIQEIIEELRLK